MELSKEETDFSHHEKGAQEVKVEPEKVADDLLGRAFAVDNADLPKSYYRSLNFIGSIFAIGLSLAAGVAGFSLIAPILGYGK